MIIMIMNNIPLYVYGTFSFPFICPWTVRYRRSTGLIKRRILGDLAHECQLQVDNVLSLSLMDVIIKECEILKGLP